MHNSLISLLYLMPGLMAVGIMSVVFYYFFRDLSKPQYYLIGKDRENFEKSMNKFWAITNNMAVDLNKDAKRVPYRASHMLVQNLFNASEELHKTPVPFLKMTGEILFNADTHIETRVLRGELKDHFNTSTFTFCQAMLNNIFYYGYEHYRPEKLFLSLCKLNFYGVATKIPGMEKAIKKGRIDIVIADEVAKDKGLEGDRNAFSDELMQLMQYRAPAAHDCYQRHFSFLERWEKIATEKNDDKLFMLLLFLRVHFRQITLLITKKKEIGTLYRKFEDSIFTWTNGIVESNYGKQVECFFGGIKIMQNLPMSYE